MIKKEQHAETQLVEAIAIQKVCETNFKEIVPKFIRANEGLRKITRK